jgi:hypothetical protein
VIAAKNPAAPPPTTTTRLVAVIRSEQIQDSSFRFKAPLKRIFNLDLKLRCAKCRRGTPAAAAHNQP